MLDASVVVVMLYSVSQCADVDRIGATSSRDMQAPGFYRLNAGKGRF